MKYSNPIIKGFNPDPSICRVGNNYYLATSSFEYYPGIPIYHSTDLINWELIGHCIDRVEQLDLNEAKPSGGIWAPTIRYNNGKFYVTATFSGKGNLIISSEQPASGYSNPIWVDMDGIDPSIFFENGEVYYCANDCGSREGNGEGISVAKINIDNGCVIGEIKRVYEGNGGGWLEAPHIYHIDEYYYLFAAEGGSGWGHMVTVARSTSIWGPYESCPYNPILTNRNDTSKQILEAGHADLIDDGDGNYYIVHLGIRPSVGSASNLGRETFLLPILKKNGWFWIKDGKSTLVNEINSNCIQKEKSSLIFDLKNYEWEKQWVFRGLPKLENYRRNDGKLIIKASENRLTEDKPGVTFLGVRQPDFSFSINVVLDSENEFGLRTGIAVYLSPQFMYRIYKCIEEDGVYIVVDKIADDFYQTAYKKKIESSDVEFIVSADKHKYYFSYILNDTLIDAIDASTRFLCTAFAGKCFTGAIVGIFAECVSEKNNEVTVTKIKVQ